MKIQFLRWILEKEHQLIRFLLPRLSIIQNKRITINDGIYQYEISVDDIVWIVVSKEFYNKVKIAEDDPEILAQVWSDNE